MKKYLVFSLLAALGACSSTAEPIYLRNPASGEVVVCDGSLMGGVVDSVEMCATNKERQGFQRIVITQRDRYGNPVEYKVDGNPYWPKER